MANQIYSTKITLSESRVASLMEGTTVVRDNDMVQTLAQESLTKLADGGILLPGPVVKRVEKILGKLEDPMEIAEAVEAGGGREGDNIVVSMVMDPIFVGPLEEKAISCGMAVDALASELQSQILNGGMLINMPIETLPIYLTPEQHAVIKRKLELPEAQPLFGDNLARYFGWGREEVAPVEEDLFAGKV